MKKCRFLQKNTYNVQKEEKKDEKKEKKKNNKTQVRSTKVTPQLNPYCNKCLHKPLQSFNSKRWKKISKRKKL